TLSCLSCNVSCADESFVRRTSTKTHQIPSVWQEANGERERVQIYGDDYPTEDGTAVRDYIHVSDLAEAHLLALSAARSGQHQIYNLGNGAGFSVQQVIDTCRAITGHPIPATVSSRRSGDPAVLVASSEQAHAGLAWKPYHTGLADIIRDAWKFTTTGTTGIW